MVRDQREMGVGSNSKRGQKGSVASSDVLCCDSGKDAFRKEKGRTSFLSCSSVRRLGSSISLTFSSSRTDDWRDTDMQTQLLDREELSFLEEKHTLRCHVLQERHRSVFERPRISHVVIK